MIHMEKLIELLKDGRSRSMEMLAAELGMSMEQVKRDIEFLENMGIIKRIDLGSAGASCTGCSGCSGPGAACHGCVPEGGFQNMGTMWEVVE